MAAVVHPNLYIEKRMEFILVFYLSNLGHHLEKLLMVVYQFLKSASSDGNRPTQRRKQAFFTFH
jgi:hypothetical protein